jgi:hypothetical protein
MEYDVYIIAFPQEKNLEEYFYEATMNIPSLSEEPIYVSYITGLKSDNIKEEFERCINYGFA